MKGEYMLKSYFDELEYEKLKQNKDLLFKTLEIVLKVFDEKVDKGGLPYYNHLLKVYGGVSSYQEKIIALLHDIVEDTDITYDDLKEFGYDNNIIDALKVLTKNKGEYYPDYIERRRTWSRESGKRRRKKITAYEENRKKIDPVFKLKKQIRGEIRASFNRRGYRKSERTEYIVGCTLTELYAHLCMTYRVRYGKEYNAKEVVHIDHIIPLSNAHTKKEVIELCRWDNLQLLTAKDNLIKNANKSLPSYKEFNWPKEKI